MSELQIERDAFISPCGTYRWTLHRNWCALMRQPWLGWIMLNPSTADASVDDATIRRCIRFAASRGFGGIAVRNLFSLRATDPAELRKHPDPIGSRTDQHILELWDVCPQVVAAWGVHGTYLGRDREAYELVRAAGHQLHCLGTTKDGHPRHPLYLPNNVQSHPFTMPEVSHA